MQFPLNQTLHPLHLVILYLTTAMCNVYILTELLALIASLPSSYHHNAYFMQQASVVVRQVDLSQFVKFMELVFQYQNSECRAGLFREPHSAKELYQTQQPLSFSTIMLLHNTCLIYTCSVSEWSSEHD